MKNKESTISKRLAVVIAKMTPIFDSTILLLEIVVKVETRFLIVTVENFSVNIEDIYRL